MFWLKIQLRIFLTSNQCQKCEESVADLRTEIATNLTRVQDLFSRKKSAGIVDQQVIITDIYSKSKGYIEIHD